MNSQSNYSLTRILLHWLIAIIVIGLFASGYWMVDLDYYSEWYTKAPHWHKSVGLLLLFALILSFFWRRFTAKPDYEKTISSSQRIMAKVVQSLMSLLTLFIIISGYLITTAKGNSVSVFNWFEISAIISDIKNQEDIAGVLHEYMAFALIGLVILHAGAALYHHFVTKDRTLRKILGL